MKDPASYAKECGLQAQSPREAMKSFKQGTARPYLGRWTDPLAACG